jgi:hypothetical protein
MCFALERHFSVETLTELSGLTRRKKGRWSCGVRQKVSSLSGKISRSSSHLNHRRVVKQVEACGSQKKRWDERKQATSEGSSKRTDDERVGCFGRRRSRCSQGRRKFMVPATRTGVRNGNAASLERRQLTKTPTRGEAPERQPVEGKMKRE